ncbi:hypothetical protein DFH11DRAFT_1516599 [Phellopilus nigrolimitatus]|nr:hypothetical protein DFH11DRAFT_1516599 [Phellopilus nigrolimitatus]
MPQEGVTQAENQLNPQDLLSAFRSHYRRFEHAIQEAISSNADSTVVSRIGDELDEYVRLVNEYQQVLDRSHHGRPIVVETVQSGGRGRPSYYIDPDFLRWAYSLRSTSSIAQYLNVSRTTVRNALLEHGISQPQQSPFHRSYTQPDSLSTPMPQPDPQPLAVADDILDPQLPFPSYIPNDVLPSDPVSSALTLASTANERQPMASFTGPLSDMSDAQLDDLLLQLRSHYRRAGVTMLEGMLRRLGHRLPRERIRSSLMRIDPVQRVFSRITIRRRVYSVPGPNALWHHDGQHGAIVHNVRIERLWVDVTAQVTATWADHFTVLELHHGLDINNVNHIWLLHQLFLPVINQQLSFFADSWNQHRMQIRDGPNRSPADMFGFDMLVHGVRGAQLPLNDLNDHMSAEELEVFGVDWEGLQDDRLLHSQRLNNTADEQSSSWIGRTGPPEHLNEVALDSPNMPITLEELVYLNDSLQAWIGSVEDSDINALWSNALAITRSMYGHSF